MKLKIYGCRGSIPFFRKGGGHFGGNTSCMRLFSGDYSILLDAGSGLANYCHDIKESREKLQVPQDILLSHLHMDHIMGLCAFGPVFDEKRGIRVFTVSRNEKNLKSQIFGAFKPPYWPLRLEDKAYAECVEIHEDNSFAAGPFIVTPFAANHPDKTTSFHITDGEKSLVYMLDNEMQTMDDASYKNMVKYCRQADMVVFDAAYSPDDYPRFRGWGHSTVLDGMKLRRESGCKRMLFTHFAQKYEDAEILGWSRYFDQDADADCYMFSSDEMEVVL